MTVRFASFNVENLFARPKALNTLTWAEGRPILEAYAEFNALIQLADYTPAVKARMIELLLRVEVYRSDGGIVHRNRVTDPRWAWLRANRGAFDVDHQDSGIEIVANNRSDWIGWLELAKETINEPTVDMTARVIQDVGADVLGVVEAENRPALDHFNQERLLDPYEHIMLIDGNDTRGIDVGIMTTTQIEILNIRSNVDVPDPDAPAEHLFSRDCAMYECLLASGATVWVLLNHFKSQSGGGGDKRLRQAEGVGKITADLIADGETNIVVMGDLDRDEVAESREVIRGRGLSLIQMLKCSGRHAFDLRQSPLNQVRRSLVGFHGVESRFRHEATAEAGSSRQSACRNAVSSDDVRLEEPMDAVDDESAVPLSMSPPLLDMPLF